MSRAVWFVAGAGAGIYAVVRAPAGPRRRSPPRASPTGSAGLALGCPAVRCRGRAGRARRRRSGDVRERLGARARTAVPARARADRDRCTDDHDQERATTDGHRGDPPPVPCALRGRPGGAPPCVPSASLLLDDPNLLFVNAGMVPFKPYFLGQETPPYDRAVSVQKCVRTPDIEEVGKTTRHGTFFQMCGNFSFGDYFKEGAIELAWELVTKPVPTAATGWTESRLYPSVYEDDPEAVALWRKVTGLPDERIVELGRKENYWSHGRARARRSLLGDPLRPRARVRPERLGTSADCRRARGPLPGVLEPRLHAGRAERGAQQVGLRHRRAACRSKNIDTGMGLERVAFLLQGVAEHVRDRRDLPGHRAGRRAHRAPLRRGPRATTSGSGWSPTTCAASMMLIGDGVTPGNEGARLRAAAPAAPRGALDAAARATRTRRCPSCCRSAGTRWRETYPELHRDWERISTRRLRRGGRLPRRRCGPGRRSSTWPRQATKSGSGADRLPGDKAFALHDTYGFPIDLTLEMASEQGLAVDEDGFRRLMAEQRERAKADARAKKGAHTDAGAYREVADALGRAVEFTGYDEVVTEGTVRGLVVADGSAPAAPGGRRGRAGAGPHPLLRRGRWPARRPGRHRARRTAPGSQVLDVQSPSAVSSCTRPGWSAARSPSAPGHRRWSTSSGASRSARAPTPRRTWSTRPSARRSATPPPRPVPRTLRAGSASTSPPPASVPASVMADVEARVNDLVLADLAVQAEMMTQERGPRLGRHGAVRREVRRRGAGDLGRRLGPRAVRRHPRRPLGPARRRQAAGRVLHRLRRTPGRGTGRRRRLPLPGPRARARRPAHRSAQGAPARSCRERVHDMVERLRARREGDREGPPGPAARGRPASSPPAAEDVDGRAGRRPTAPTAPPPATSARWPSTSAAGCRAGAPGVVVVVGVRRRQDPRWSRRSTTRPAALGRLGQRPRDARSARTLGGKGGGKDDVAQGGGTDPSRVDAALRRGRAPRSAAVVARAERGAVRRGVADRASTPATPGSGSPAATLRGC